MSNKKIIKYKKPQDDFWKEVDLRLTEKSVLEDFAMLQKLVSIANEHFATCFYCELINLGTKKNQCVPKSIKEYEEIKQEQTTILIYLN
tara:strand:+ start:5012 stop:5278 length:267 start_codon:yes stop_codon:yes gene_type:complete